VIGLALSPGGLLRGAVMGLQFLPSGVTGIRKPEAGIVAQRGAPLMALGAVADGPRLDARWLHDEVEALDNAVRDLDAARRLRHTRELLVGQSGISEARHDHHRGNTFEPRGNTKAPVRPVMTWYHR
jgi:hypothetical protein